MVLLILFLLGASCAGANDASLAAGPEPTTPAAPGELAAPKTATTSTSTSAPSTTDAAMIDPGTTDPATAKAAAADPLVATETRTDAEPTTTAPGTLNDEASLSSKAGTPIPPLLPEPTLPPDRERTPAASADQTSSVPPAPATIESPLNGDSDISFSVDFSGGDEATTNIEARPAEPRLVDQATAMAVNESYYFTTEQVNQMWSDPAGTYDWDAVAVDPMRADLTAEQVDRANQGVVMRWPIPSAYTDVIIGTEKIDPLLVDGQPVEAVQIRTCVVDDAIYTYPGDGVEKDPGAITYWITVTMVRHDDAWKMHHSERTNQATGASPCGTSTEDSVTVEGSAINTDIAINPDIATNTDLVAGEAPLDEPVAAK